MADRIRRLGSRLAIAFRNPVWSARALSKVEFIRPGADGMGLVSPASSFQSAIRSMCSYAFAVVIEKADEPTARFISPKHGTEWQPFL